MQRPRISILMQISIVHFVSHVHMLGIPALLPLLPNALGVTFVELGASVSLFNIMSALFQAPVGFIVDRRGARIVLAGGLALGACSFFFLALFPSYVGLLAAAAALGLANAVYHPGDYAILSRAIHESVMGKSFSIHSFAGYCGSAGTPALATAIALWCGIPAAFAVMGVLAVVALAILCLAQTDETAQKNSKQSAGKQQASGQTSRASVWTLSVLMLVVLYTLLSLSTDPFERFSASALIKGYGVGLPLANTALTAFLVCTAIGVLSGGVLADRTRRHGYVAASAFAVAAVLTGVVARGSLPPLILILVFALIGLLTGIIVPSRDMLVRAASPKGSEGKVFGIVSTGFNIGGTVGPLLCGFFLDHGMPSLVFTAAALFMVATVALTWIQEKRRA